MSTRKPKEETSRTVSDIVVEKKTVLLVIGKEKIPISQETYLSNYYYPGKKLTKSDIEKLRKEKKTIRADGYLEYLLSQGRYTQKQVSDRLKKRYQLNENEIKEKLAPYLEAGIIDDETYALDYIESQLATGHGKRAINQQLKRRGISSSLLKKDSLQESFENTTFDLVDLVKRADKQKSHLTIEKRKESIYALLLRRGYSDEESKEAIQTFYESRTNEEKDLDQKQRATLLKKEAEKCYNSFAKRYPDRYQFSKHFFAHLFEKGFQSQEIKNWLESKGYTFDD
jgi:regulatory protein